MPATFCSAILLMVQPIEFMAKPMKPGLIFWLCGMKIMPMEDGIGLIMVKNFYGLLKRMDGDTCIALVRMVKTKLWLPVATMMLWTFAQLMKRMAMFILWHRLPMPHKNISIVFRLMVRVQQSCFPQLTNWARIPTMYHLLAILPIILSPITTHLLLLIGFHCLLINL